MKKERKAFNFYKSYFDVYNELSEKNKLIFIDALLKRQFWGIEPEELKGQSKFAYISQKHNIDCQVEGFENKTGTTLRPPVQGGMQGGTQGGTQQEKEEVKVKEKEEVNIYPTFLEFSEYAKEKTKEYQLIYSEVDLKMKYDAWNDNKWINGNGKKIKNWKTTLLNTMKYIFVKDESNKPYQKPKMVL